MDKFHYLEVTHAALERALLRLGFEVSQHETHRLYENKEHGTLLMLPPDISMEQQVRPAHLSSARHAVVSFGVTDQATLERLLMEQGPGGQAPPPAEVGSPTAYRRRSHSPSIPPPTVPVEAH